MELDLKKAGWDFPAGAVGKNPLPMCGSWVRSSVWEDSTCHGAAKPLHHNF